MNDKTTELKPAWRVSYAHSGSRKAWFIYEGTFVELHQMMAQYLDSNGVGEMYIEPLYNNDAPTIDPKAPYRPNPEITFGDSPASNHEDLVERLRTKAQELLEHRHATAGWLMQEAADAIEALGGEK